MRTCANRAHGLGGGFAPLEDAGEFVVACQRDGDRVSPRWGDGAVHEQVVRCRDCRFYTPESMSREERGFGVYEDVWEPGGCFNPERCSHGGDPFGEWYVVGINTDPDGFCAWGKLKEE